MQKLLFGPGIDRTALPDSAMWSFLRSLRADSEFEPFRIWLVGSRISPGREQSDIDVVLSPRPGVPLSDRTIERGLWYCRHHGLYGTSVPCVVDACFRVDGPTLDAKPLPPDAILRTVKLFSPNLAREILAGRITEYRRMGCFSIDYLRRAGETQFYHKLPKRSFDDLLSPSLRPAIEVDNHAAIGYLSIDRSETSSEVLS